MKNNLKEIREKNNLTQEALANLVFVSRQTIISIEKEYYVPTTPLALKLAQILKIKVEELFILEKTDWK
ncbi:MAG: family transcriptional regulator [Chitinophagaceae bacterium]|nr:family transcriptional regulator [Chitinophagaceae bacterium]